MGVSAACAAEIFVATDGSDDNKGSAADPFRTIGAAAEVAQPGDVITVRGGTYRERVDPPRGGTSHEQRIVYRAAPGEEVVIKGSERVHGWEKVQNDTWKLTLPNEFFGDFNPYDDPIGGDWFHPRGRKHHTGAVYLDGHWLTEAVELEDVLEPARQEPIWAHLAPPGFLLNVAWFRFDPQAGGEGEEISAASFSDQRGLQTAGDFSEGEVIGYIEHDNWARYDEVDFGDGVDRVAFRAASATDGGVIEIRSGARNGELLGSVSVTHTGGWHTWETFVAPIDPVGGVETLYLVFKSHEEKIEPNPLWEAETHSRDAALWYGEADASETTIWAQFKDVDPNEADVEINVRQTVFYPEEPGRNYITVRGFKMRHAATPWAPPTAEQIGLIGTHWSKGWIIEDNDIRYSACTGITLGKHGDEYDNTSADTAEGYVETIYRARDNHGWSKENIGHHVVRNNRISHCEQAGLVGSLGAIFSTIEDNVIHDIHVRQLFSGAEMAGIKLHAPIDTLIARNHIFRTARGMWLDWMTQGTRVTRNLFHDNPVYEDLFLEVNHGPYVVDNNILLSPFALHDQSQGGAFLHNLFAGGIARSAELNRETPYHPEHSTEIAGLADIRGGDNRFYNNIFSGWQGLAPYDSGDIRPVWMAGNVFLNGAQPGVDEEDPLVLPEFDPGIAMTREGDAVTLRMSLDPAVLALENPAVTTELLGRVRLDRTLRLSYKNVDGSDLRIDTDHHGVARSETNPTAGPFETLDDEIATTLRGFTTEVDSTIYPAVELRFSVESGQSYVIDATTDPAEWDPITEPVSGEAKSVRRYFSVRNEDRRFFRVRSEDEPVALELSAAREIEFFSESGRVYRIQTKTRNGEWRSESEALAGGDEAVSRFVGVDPLEKREFRIVSDAPAEQ